MSSLSPAPICHNTGASTPGNSPHRLQRFGNRTPSSSAVVPFPRSMATDARRHSKSPRLMSQLHSPSSRVDLYAPGPSSVTLMHSPSASPAKEARARKQAREAASAAAEAATPVNRAATRKLSRRTIGAAWSRSRGSSHPHRLDSSGSDDLDADMVAEDRTDLSPAPLHSSLAQVSTDALAAQHHPYHFSEAVHQHQTPGPSTAERYHLERHFATHVSMTPPASFGSRTSHETPFAWSAQPSAIAPATDARPPTSGIPRSRAFGQLAPLSRLDPSAGFSSHERRSSRDSSSARVAVAASTSTEAANVRRNLRMSDVATQGLGIMTEPLELGTWHGSEQEDETLELAEDAKALEDEPSFSVGKRRLEDLGLSTQGSIHARCRKEIDGLSGSSVARRRGKTPAFLKGKHLEADAAAMDVDSDNDADGQPLPSPSPLGDGAFVAQAATPVSLEGDAAQLLQPGILLAPGRRGSAANKVLATDAGDTQRPGFDRGPYLSKTPDRSRSAGSSRGQRSRAFSSAPAPRPLTEFLTPRSTSSSALADDKLAGAATLFCFASQPRPTTRTMLAEGPAPEPKRRSTDAPPAPLSVGKLFQSEIAASRSLEDIDAEDSVAPGWQPDLLSTPASSMRMPRLSTPGPSNFREEKGRGHGDFNNDASSHAFSEMNSFGDIGNDSGVAFGDDGFLSTPLKKGTGLLAGTLGLRKTATSGNGLTHSRKSLSADSLTSPSKADAVIATPPRREASFHGKMPGSRPTLVTNPFGPKERSALANETRWSDMSSTASSPDVAAADVSGRKPFTSPARSVHSEKSTSGNAEGSSSSTYLTPQNFKSVKPLQAAFMSTGLVSKRNRARENSDGSSGGGGPDNLPVPPRPNFGNALGLREVVAAANAHAAASADKISHHMPDTPVKKGAAGMVPFPMAGGGSSLRPPAQAARRAPSPLGLHSPAHESVSSGCSADSPLLADACDSPTFNLLSLSPPSTEHGVSVQRTQGWPAFSSMPRSRRSPMSLAHAFQPPADRSTNEEDDPSSDPPASPSTSQRPADRSPPPTSLRKGRLRGSQLSQSFGTRSGPGTISSSGVRIAAEAAGRPSLQFDSPSKAPMGYEASIRPGHKRAQLSDVEHAARQRPPYPRNRGSLGLQRKNSSGLAESMLGDEAVPMTPTRTAAQLKWFEAAQVLTTPSPSSRKQAAQQLRAQRRSLVQGGHRASHLSESFAPPETPARKDHASLVKATATATTLANPSFPFTGPENAVNTSSRMETCFTIEAVIGQGEFSEVIKAEDKASGIAYAVKRMKKAYAGPRDRLRRLEEVDILRHLSRNKGHPNIISMSDAWEEGGHLFVQTELCSLGTLAFFLDQYGQSVGALDEPRLWKILAELSSGLAYIHGNGILHLDLKPANVFITELGTLKIGDFGMATRWPPPDAMTILEGAALEAADGASMPGKLANPEGIASLKVRRLNGHGSWSLEREGDREYLAPEVMFEGRYGKAADIFSLGLIILEAAGNVQLPDNGEPWQKLRKDDFSDVDLSFLSGTMLRMLSSLLASDPAGRLTVEQIVEHPVMEVVRSRMAQGLLTSELDQLPDFDLTHSESGLTASGSSSSICSASSDRTAGRSDRPASSAGEPGAGSSGSILGLSGISASTSDRTTASTSSSLSSHLALNIRGALIQEPEEEFVREVVEADPLEQAICRSKQGGQMMMMMGPYGSSVSSNASSTSCLSPTPASSAWTRRALAEVQPCHAFPRYGSDSEQDDEADASSWPSKEAGENAAHRWADAMDLDDD